MCAVEQIWILWIDYLNYGALWVIWGIQVIFVGFHNDGVIQSYVLKTCMCCGLFLGNLK